MTNPVMLKYWSKYLHVTYDKELISKLNSIREYIEEDLSFSAWIHGKAVYIEHAKSVVQKYWEKENRPPLLSLLPEDQKFGEEKLAELARENQIQLTRDTWFVSLHVRDSGYKLGDHRKLDVIDDFRNADIESYVPAIEEIIRRGGIVVRVGDPKMKHLRPIPGLIDYAHSNHRSNLMDVYLFSACKFFIGVSSGPVLNPIIFGVPTLMTNFMPVVGRPHASNCLFLPKLLWLNDEKRYLTFREILSTSIGKIYTTVGYVEKNISIIDNTKEDLMNATIEMLNEIYKNESSHPHHFRDLQDELKKLYERYSGYGDLGFLSYEYLKKCHQLKVI
jgi:putative glycosyltransferase (TIGR04372 family)